MTARQYTVAVVGAGPAGLFAARKLCSNGVRVALFNRDIRPGGLAEYGIYPDKVKTKDALRLQFQKIIESPLLTYYGNVTVCGGGYVTIRDLLRAGFQAILVATGAQGTKSLNIPGENLPGVYHAKDLVYYYNQLPPYSLRKFIIGRRVALVGAGNVMLDVARYLLMENPVDEVVTLVRRGPAEVKFNRTEYDKLTGYVDRAALNIEFERIAPHMIAVGQDITDVRESFIGKSTSNGSSSGSKLCFEFLTSPRRILGDWTSGVSTIVVENNKLIRANGNFQAQGLETHREINADTLICCIGDSVDGDFCLPNNGHAYVQVDSPRFPVDGNSYEAFDPDAGRPMERIFLAGWARQASTGLVGVARKDGENAASAILHYLQTQKPRTNPALLVSRFEQKLFQSYLRVVNVERLKRLVEVEQARALDLGLEMYKFPTNEDMFSAIGM